MSFVWIVPVLVTMVAAGLAIVAMRQIDEIARGLRSELDRLGELQASVHDLQAAAAEARMRARDLGR